MRIALVHPFSFPEVTRGAERYLDDLSWYLSGRGHDVVVVTGTTGAPGVVRRDGGPTVIRRRHVVPRRLERRRIAAEETFGAVALPAIARARPDVVHALVPSTALAGRLLRRPTVLTVLGHPTAEDVRAQPGRGRLTRLAVRRASIVTAFSEASASNVGSVLGREAEALPPGVRRDRFPVELSPRTGPPRLLFAGDAGDPRKRVDVLVRAFATLLDRRPDAVLRLVGPADHDALLDRLAPPSRVRKAIEDGGVVVDGLGARYREATLTVLPARDEAFGIVLVESLASGTPVVCTAAGGMPEIASDSAVSRTFPDGDARALARALDEAIDLAAEAQTPARCAAHAAGWSWTDVVGPAHEDLYRRVVAAR